MKTYKKVVSGLAVASSVVGFVAVAQAEGVFQNSVAMNEKLVVPYVGKGVENLPQKGFLQDFGSAMTLKKIHSDGTIDFVGVTDRGPNADSPKVKRLDGTISSSKLFPTPDFHLSTAVIRLFPDGTVKVLKQSYIQNSDGSLVTGLPHPSGTEGDSQEVPLTLNADGSLSILNQSDANSLDPEGIAIDSKGNTWISDEYGPYVVKMNKENKIEAKLSPGKGLPAIFAKRIPNRGLENMTILPNGHVLTVMQSVLDVDGTKGKQEDSTLFIRMAEIDPATNETIHSYAFPITLGLWKKTKDCKLGDMYPLDNHRVLIIEQGVDKSKNTQKLIHLVDFSNATDITNRTLDGLLEKEDGSNALEMAPDVATLTNVGVQMAKKTVVVDLATIGYTADKAEGLVLLPDGKTIALINDNDFGFTMIEATNTTNLDIQNDYLLDEATDVTTKKGTTAAPIFDLVPNDAANQQVVLTRYMLPTSLDDVAPTITGIENNAVTKRKVTLHVQDNLKGSKPTVVTYKNGSLISTPKKLSFKEKGHYIAKATDASGNETTVSFEIR